MRRVSRVNLSNTTMPHVIRQEGILLALLSLPVFWQLDVCDFYNIIQTLQVS